MAKMTYWRDSSGKIEKYAKRVMKIYYPDLLKANFIYTFRNNDKFDDEGQVILAEARKIGKKERDLYSFDFEINVHADTWVDASEELKYRIIYHELKHCGLELDEEGIPKRDENDKLVTKIVKHDLIVKTFKCEIDIFGVDECEDVADFFAKAMADREKAKKRRKKFLEKLGITQQMRKKDLEMLSRRRDDKDEDEEESRSERKKKKDVEVVDIDRHEGGKKKDKKKKKRRSMLDD